MKIRNVLKAGRRLRESGGADCGFDGISDAAKLGNRPKCHVVRELHDLLQGLGHNACNYLAADEVALADCIAKLGVRDINYYPTSVVETIAKFLQAKCELSRALAQTG